MMKKTIHLLALGIVMSTAAFAQSVEEGVKAFYNGNYDGAVNILEKQASNPQAAYWLAQAYYEQGKNNQANTVITSAIAANANDPLLLAAKGQSLLLQNKPAEAKQSFEAAITAAGKKDVAKAAALNAVGRGITEVYNNVDKVGDINYAVQKLEEAKAIVMGMKEKSRDLKLLADINTNLGDAHRKANPGEGSKAFTAYQDALMADPSFARAELSKANIFRSQRNVQLYIETLNKAVNANPNFIPAYDQLYEYYAYTANDAKTARSYIDKIIANSQPSPQLDYYKAIASYLGKQFGEAIATGKSIIAKEGPKTNPKVYKMIAYSLIENKDTAAAIPFVEDYFKNQKKEDFVPLDYTLMATAYSTTPGKEADIIKNYMAGVAADTSIDGKLDILEAGAKLFRGKGQNITAADLYSKILEIKPASKITINDYFNAGYYGYYQAKQYEKSWKIFDAARTKFPDVNYGYLWTFNNSRIFDSANAKNTLVPDAEKLLAFSQTDKAADAKANLYNAAFTLATYYINVKSDKVNGLKYLQTAYAATDNQQAKDQIASFIKQLGGTVSGGSGTSTTSSGGGPKQPAK